jgi:membrane protease YdiL (CAAX protease family)
VDKAKQHTPMQSILFHLLPGLVILVLILLFSQPYFARVLGIDAKLSPVLGYLLGLLFGLLPVQLAILLIAGRNETGKYTIRKIIRYTQKSRLKEYFLFVPAMILYFLVLFVFLSPIIQPYLVQTFFSWWPEKYNFQFLLQNPSTLAGYKGIGVLIFAYIMLSCISGPFVEELYFRGYLLPRMEGYAGKRAPFLNTVLFSIYHFFSPWENLIRIAASYPLIYLVWKKRDIRFGMLVHILINTIGGIIALFTISTN